ncbi:MAG: ABC transporter ATP-binding protein [Candidatus Izemoplasmatales bacterium]
MIDIINLTQTYRSGKGVFNLNFNIEKGEVFGYLGPNGAGKTTTIRNILGFTNAKDGLVLINGLNSRTETEEINKIIGFLPGEIAFYNQMKAKDFLDLLAKLRNLTDFTFRQHLEERFKLETDIYIKKMSKGMKQKLAIIAAFMHDPEILILDEPTSGLDPLMQNIFLDLIKEEKQRGKTILLSSHIFEEVEKICDRAGIIKDGYLIALEDINSLKAKASDIFEVYLAERNDDLLKTDLDVTHINDNLYHIAVKNNYDMFLKGLQDFKVIKINSLKQSLEDIFMKYYGDGQYE